MAENTQPTPQMSPPISSQISTMRITTEDVEAAFKLFYNRSPLEGDNIQQYIGISPSKLLQLMLNSPEFLSRAGVDSLIFNAAKKIQS
jgi:hypothetical protein